MASALVRDVESLHEQLQVAPPPRVARRVRALVQEALGVLADARRDEIAPHLVHVALGPDQTAHYAPAPDSLPPKQAAAAFAAARRRGREVADSVYASVGPLLSPSEAADRLGVTRATVHNWRREGRLLALHPNRHTYLYPAFQFVSPAEADSGLLPGLPEVLVALGDLSPLGKALWLQTGQPLLGGRKPVDMLRADPAHGVAAVLDAAAAAYTQGG